MLFLFDKQIIVKKNYYSKSQVTKAWKILVEYENYKNKCKEEVSDAFDILSYWRSSHIESLDIAFNKIQDLTIKIDKKALFAKRLKRLESIKNKLIRQETMSLGRMYDIWWCRVIVSSPNKLKKILRELKKWPEFLKNDWSLNIKNYIEKPKIDWYRSIHLIWNFNGKNIEVQLRTSIQHDWATALEIVDIFTKQNLKSNQWQKNWSDFFTMVSKEFEEMEKIHLFSPNNWERVLEYYKNLNEKDKFLNHRNVKRLLVKLNIINKFLAFTISVDVANNAIFNDKLIHESEGYVLIHIDLKEQKLFTRYFNQNEAIVAEEEYTKMEQKFTSNQNVIIALIASSSIWDIKDAYPNYFADSRDFIKYLNVIDQSPVKKWIFYMI